MGWESGWTFYSGDEGDVYGEGDEYYESHCCFYDIRDICRIDPDIIPLLNLPYGTMQMRGEDGAWYLSLIHISVASPLRIWLLVVALLAVF